MPTYVSSNSRALFRLTEARTACSELRIRNPVSLRSLLPPVPLRSPPSSFRLAAVAQLVRHLRAVLADEAAHRQDLEDLEVGACSRVQAYFAHETHCKEQVEAHWAAEAEARRACGAGEVPLLPLPHPQSVAPFPAPCLRGTLLSFGYSSRAACKTNVASLVVLPWLPGYHAAGASTAG